MERTKLRLLRRTLLAILVVLLFVRAFVGDLYRVESTSMEPTLHAAPEQVFVRFARGFLPSRFELAVFTPASEADAVVKRVGGLPGELVSISNGDLWIEGRRLDADAPRPEAILIFDSRSLELTSAFSVSSASLERVHGGWKLDAVGRRADLNFAKTPSDDYFDAKGQLVAGAQEVNDLQLALSARWQGSGKVTLRATEEGDGFELELDVEQGIPVRARIVHRAGASPPAVLASSDDLRGDPPWAVSLENLDNHLIAHVGESTLSADYEANTPMAGVVDLDKRHLRPRLGVAVADLVMNLEWIQVSRDLYYTADGPIGTGSPAALGPDEVFFLGDNSANSHDSRVLGPVRLEDLAGRATMVVWPPSAARRLGALRSLRPPSGGD